MPSDAKWFPIFATNKNVMWSLSTAPPPFCPCMGRKDWCRADSHNRINSRCVPQTNDLTDLSYLTLADYTILTDRARTVTMNGVQLSTTKKEALVTINAVAYNSTYSIDLAKDGTASSQVKVYSATAQVIGSSYEVDDGGLCTQNSAQDHATTLGTKTGLQFRIVNQCAAYLDSKANVYRSRYNVSVILKNGGVGWRVDDQVTVTQSGKSFTVRVSAEKFVYTYASDGIATYTTPSNANSGTLTVTDIITNLSTAVNAITGYDTDTVGNVIRIKRTDTRDFNLSVRGGVTNNAMTAIKGTANNITELPGQCFPDFEVKVKNTDSSDADDVRRLCA